MVKVITSDDFEDTYNRIDNSLRIQVDKLLRKLIDNPELGKPMRFNRKGTREVYAGSFRLSYAYDNSNDVLYFLDIYHKDEQ